MEKMKDQNGRRMLDDQELEQVNGGQYVTIRNDVDVYRYIEGDSEEFDYMDRHYTCKEGDVLVVIETIQEVIDGVTYLALDKDKGWVRLDQVERSLR